MTYQEFLEALKQTPRNWKLKTPKRQDLPKDERGILVIRYERHNGIRQLLDGCPVTSLCSRSLSMLGWPAAVRELGLDENLAWQIIHAADGRAFADPQVRQDLLLACGLWPEQPCASP